MEVVWGNVLWHYKRKQTVPLLVMAAAFIANYFFGVSAIIIILLCIGLGIVTTLSREKQKKGGSL